MFNNLNEDEYHEIFSLFYDYFHLIDKTQPKNEKYMLLVDRAHAEFKKYELLNKIHNFLENHEEINKYSRILIMEKAYAEFYESVI